MFCRKCGKELDYDGTICKECEQAGGFDELKVDVPAKGNGRMEGFKVALIAAILGGIAFAVSAVALGVISVAAQLVEEVVMSGIDQQGIATMLGTISILFILVSIGLIIPAVMMGIKSIICFVCAKKEGRVRPIATLICGIAANGLSVAAWMYIMLTLVMFMFLL